VAKEGPSAVDPGALSKVLEDARVQLDDALNKLERAGLPITDIIKRRPSALEDNNSSCNTACSCGGGGGGGGGGGNCVAIRATRSRRG